MFYNPKIFENPKEFIPERWEKEENQKHKNLVSMIFSAGPRSCIGKYLAMTEIKVMIVKFLKRYESIVELGLKEGR
jgi:cytochrome P450